MKTARLILWIAFPISIIAAFVLAYLGAFTTKLAANIAVSVIFAIPVTAMLLQTLMNKEKNLSKNSFLFKMTFIISLYTMIIFMFVTNLLTA